MTAASAVKGHAALNINATTGTPRTEAAMPTPYDHHWQTVRLTVLERDQYFCQLHLDGCTLTADAVDHIIPLNEGGRRLDPANLRASCTHCNSRRARQRQAELARRALLTYAPHDGASRDW